MSLNSLHNSLSGQKLLRLAASLQYLVDVSSDTSPHSYQLSLKAQQLLVNQEL